MLNTLTNKHLVIAMIVAPILAVIAYLGVDNIVSEKPHKAVKGQYYPLTAKSNCRYQSGRCTLKNGDIKLTISFTDQKSDTIKLALSSNQPIENIHVALAGANPSPLPHAMKATNNELTEWEVNLAEQLINSSRLQLALAVNGSLYFAETGTEFSEYHAGFTAQ